MSARWISDGESLLLAAGTGATGHLYISTLNCNGVPEPVTPALQVTAAELHPASRRIICQSPAQTINIWELPLRDGKPASDPVSLTSSAHLNVRPVYSPDGNWIAFTSTRTGDVGVWIMDRTGSRIMRLPVPESAVSVATDWSPDSKCVYLFSNPHNQYDIFSIEIESGSIRQVTQHPANDWRARSSRDGHWLYFTSSREGKFCLWRMSVSGEPATPITSRPASSAQESPDGRWLYYAEYPAGGLFRRALDGGAEEQVLSSILDTESYAVAPNGIYYLVKSPGAHERRYSLGVPFARADLHFLDTESGRDELLLHFPRPLYGGLSLAPDGRSLAYAEMERDTQELVLIDNLW
jgi:Tol biopolymer transport system component